MDTLKNLQDISDYLNSLKEVKLMKIVKELQEIKDIFNTFNQPGKLRSICDDIVHQGTKKEIWDTSTLYLNDFSSMSKIIENLGKQLKETSSIMEIISKERLQDILTIMNKDIEELRVVLGHYICLINSTVRMAYDLNARNSTNSK